MTDESGKVVSMRDVTDALATEIGSKVQAWKKAQAR
jgi:hypothetical protein